MPPAKHSSSARPSPPHFPVTAGSFNTLCGGDGECGATWNPQGFIVSNAFVAKLNTAGSGLVYSTFLGNYEDVQGLAIAVDGALNAYVTGDSQSQHRGNNSTYTA